MEKRAQALRDARAMGFSRQDMVEAIQKLTSTHFVKSMTTYGNHKVWQDVYDTEFNGYFFIYQVPSR
jgi:motility quorum-sensing regulator / GCU-specific mRNA interferase toxin